MSERANKLTAWLKNYQHLKVKTELASRRAGPFTPRKSGSIMITGCIWEKVVFGRYLFAPSFYWEDVFSMLVLALHTAYLYAMYTQKLQGVELMYLALAAYATYVVNAGQFILKLRAARLDQEAKLREAAAVKHEGFQGMAA